MCISDTEMTGVPVCTMLLEYIFSETFRTKSTDLESLHHMVRTLIECFT